MQINDKIFKKFFISKLKQFNIDFSLLSFSELDKNSIEFKSSYSKDIWIAKIEQYKIKLQLDRNAFYIEEDEAKHYFKHKTRVMHFLKFCTHFVDHGYVNLRRDRYYAWKGYRLL